MINGIQWGKKKPETVALTVLPFLTAFLKLLATLACRAVLVDDSPHKTQAVSSQGALGEAHHDLTQKLYDIDLLM